jgi:hypothetical protein
VPSAAILILSRARLIARHPWLLLILGPILFVVTLVFVTIAINVSSGR